MPWFKLPEFVKKRACRYLLQHYLGHFFKEKLSIDQLTLDISNGIGTITQVQLDTHALNESLENVNAPVEILEGFVGSLSVSIPWKNLFRDNCKLDISGLNITVAPRHGFQTSNTLSMTESLISSSLTLSLKVAKQCMQQESESAPTFEGMEACAQTIESILNRVEVSVSDVRFQVKYFPPDRPIACIVLLKIKKIEYFDEAFYMDSEGSLSAEQNQAQNEPANGDTPASSHVYTPPIFSIKHLNLSGVTLEVGQGPHSKTVPTHDPRGFNDSSANIVRNDMYRCSLEQGTPSIGAQDPLPCELLYPIASLNGPMEIRLKLNLTDHLPDPKLKVECTAGSLHFLLSPDIVHMLAEITSGLMEELDEKRLSIIPPTGRPINPQDYIKIAPQVTNHIQVQKCAEALYSLNAVHSPRQNAESYLESLSPRDDEDPAYYSICSTLEDDLRPLDIPPAMSVTRSENIAIPCLGDPSSQLNSLASSGTPPASLLSHLNGISSSPLTPHSNFSTSPNYTPTHLPRIHKPSTAPIADSNKFVIKIGGISLALLHVSITSLYQLSGTQLDELREYAQEENVRVEELATHTQLAMLYFHRLSRLADQSDLKHITGRFLIDNLAKVAYAIPNDHLRLHISGLNAEVQISAYQTDVSVSMNGVNLSECLFDCPLGSDVTLGPLDGLKPRDTSEYALSNTQILKFHVSPERLDPCLSVRFNLSQEKRKVDNLSHQKSPYLSITDIQVSTIPFTLVLDVTLLSRIHSLLQPDMQASTYNQWTSSINYKSVFQSFHQSVSTQRQTLFQTAVNESNIPIETQISLRFKSPSIAIICRIPSLEKKDSQEAGLWWKPSLRQESFLISTTNVRASFQDSSLHKQDRTFNLSVDSLAVSLKESSTCLPVKFLLLDCLSGGQQKYPSATFRMKEEPSSLLLGESVNLQVPLDSAPTVSNISDSAYVQAAEQFASPFSSKKYVHNQEELVLPGSQLEMDEFESKAGHNSLLRLELSLPVVKIHIPSKEILQAIINRLTELVSWNPFPQSQVPTEYLDIKKLSPLTPLNQIYSAQNNGERASRLEDDSDEDQSSYNSSATTFNNQPPTFSRTDGLNSLSLSLSIDSLLITAITRVPVDHSEDDSPILDSGPTTLIADRSLQDEPVGECMLQVSFLRYFHVSGFKGDDTLKYDSLYTKKAQLSHKGILSEEPYSCVDTPNRPISPDTLPVLLYCSDHLGSLSPGLYHPKQGQFDRPPCISLAIKTKHDANNQSKSVTMSLLLKGLAMKHTFVPSDLHCFSQLSDLFSLGGADTTELQREDSLSLKSIRDKPKNNFPVLFTFYFHLRDCGIDYRPLYLPLKTFVTIGSFCFSSNIVSGAPTSMQRMLLEDIALYLSKKTFKGSPNLKEDYFCAMDFGLLEVTLRLASNGISKIPQVDLSVSSETLHIWTCADAVISIRDLLLYITSNGDHAAPVHTHQGYPTHKPLPSQSLHQEGNSLPIHEPLSFAHSISGQLIDAIEDAALDLDEEVVSNTQPGTPKARGRGRNLKEKADINETLQVLHTEDGMEISFSKSSPSERHRSHSAFSPKISNPTPLSMSMSGDFSPHQLNSMVEEDGFTLLEDPMTFQTPPEVKCYLDPSEKIRVVENHFTIPDITTSDQLQPPSHYPCPTQRYSLKDLTIIWHLYAGTDFEENSKEKYSSKNPISIPTHPPTVRFTELPSSIGKDDGLTQLSIARRPTDADAAFTPLHAPITANSTAHKHWKALGGPGRDPHNLMVIKFSKVRVQHEVYPESAEQASRFVLLVNEIEVLDKLKSSSINKFLHVFTSESMPRPTHANMLTIKGLLTRLDHPDTKEASIKVSLLPMKLNIDQDALLMIKDFFTEILETKPISFPAPPVLPTSSLTPSSLPPIPSIGPQTPEAKPIYIRSFVFYPDVPIRVDYQAKHRLHMDQGTLAGLLLSLTDLNCSEIKLKKLNSKKGFLGYDKLLEYVIQEWLMDIKSYQLPRIIGGVGPMYYITQLAQGTVDLVRLPWQQYRQDGRIFWGMQQGATSFSSSTAMATLELANRVVVTIQSVAETIYELISPNYITYRESNLQPERPQDLREGLTHACNAVSSGVSDTATNFYRTAAEEKEFGYARAVTGVIKQIPGSVIMPVIIMTKATSSMLGGAKNQLMPDARRETELKYKNNKQNQ